MDITVRGLRFSYGDATPVLNGVDLEICDGEIVAIVGPNGSGKTTLLKLISGILTPDVGTVCLGTKRADQLSPKQIAQRLAALEQEREVGFDFAVREVVAMGRHPHQSRFARQTKTDQQQIREAMALADVTAFADRSIHELSGGERQRVFLAAALAQEPQALLLDEPTAHLDINYQIQIMEIVRQQAACGLPVLMSLHDLNLAAQYADRIAILHQGHLIAVGRSADVLTEDNIRKAFRTDVIVGRNPLTNSIYINAHPPRRFPKNQRERVHLICGGGSGADVMHGLVNSFSLSAGVLSPLDSDFEVAQHLGLAIVMDAPFAPISKAAYERNLEAMRGCRGVIVCETPFGPGNLPNLRAAVEVASSVDVYILKPDEIEKRDYTKGEATSLIHELLQAGAIPVSDSEELGRHLLSN